MSRLTEYSRADLTFDVVDSGPESGDPVILLHGFPDLVEGTLEDQPNCEHTANDTGCALDAWVAAGKADPRRLASYRRLLASRAGDDLATS